MAISVQVNPEYQLLVLRDLRIPPKWLKHASTALWSMPPLPGAPMLAVIFLLIAAIISLPNVSAATHQHTPKTPTVTSEPTTNTPSSTEPSTTSPPSDNTQPSTTTPPSTTTTPPTTPPPSTQVQVQVQVQGQGQGQGVIIGKGGEIIATQGQTQGQLQGQTGTGTQTQAQIQAQSQSINILNQIIKKSGGSTIIRQGSTTQQIIILPVFVPGTGFVAPSNSKLNSGDSNHITCEFQVVSR